MVGHLLAQLLVHLVDNYIINVHLVDTRIAVVIAVHYHLNCTRNNNHIDNTDNEYISILMVPLYLLL